MVIFESTRVADVVHELDGIVDEFGYQGWTDTERKIATVVAVLCQAVRDEQLHGLTSAIQEWEKRQAQQEPGQRG